VLLCSPCILLAVRRIAQRSLDYRTAGTWRFAIGEASRPYQAVVSSGPFVAAAICSIGNFGVRSG
jgi:hypothetical protein